MRPFGFARVISVVFELCRHSDGPNRSASAAAHAGRQETLLEASGAGRMSTELTFQRTATKVAIRWAIGVAVGFLVSWPVLLGLVLLMLVVIVVSIAGGPAALTPPAPAASSYSCHLAVNTDREGPGPTSAHLSPASHPGITPIAPHRDAPTSYKPAKASVDVITDLSAQGSSPCRPEQLTVSGWCTDSGCETPPVNNINFTVRDIQGCSEEC